MAYETGTATSHLDLIRKLRTFLTTNATLVSLGQEWDELGWNDTGTYCELFLKGPGNAGLDEIFVNINTYTDAGSSMYRWTLRGATGYNSAQAIADQPGSNPQARFLALWGSSIPYWFIANGRCFKVIAKVSTTYHCMYGGFILPIATPSEYPYPLAIGGSVSTSSQIYSTATAAASNFYDPGINTLSDAGTLGLRNTSGVWLSGFNRAVSGASGTTVGTTVMVNTSPYAETQASTEYTPNGTAQSKKMRPSLDGTFALSPIVIYQSTTGDRNVFGEFDGVYHVSGFGNTAENIITISGTDYIVVPNVFRADENSYAAFKLEA